MEIKFDWKVLSEHVPHKDDYIILTHKGKRPSLFFIGHLSETKKLPVRGDGIYTSTTIDVLRKNALVYDPRLIEDTCYIFHGFWFNSDSMVKRKHQCIYVAESWIERYYWDNYIKDWPNPIFKDLNKVEHFFK